MSTLALVIKTQFRHRKEKNENEATELNSAGSFLFQLFLNEWELLENGKVIQSNLRIILFRNLKARFDLKCFYFRVVHAPVTEEKTLSSQPLHRELSLMLKEIKVTEQR